MHDLNEATDLSFIDASEEAPLNDMALVSFLTGLGGWVALMLVICSAGSSFAICCFGIAGLSWVVAVFTGNFGLREIAGRGETGRQLARWGIYSGAAGLLLAVAAVVLLLASALGIISISMLDQLGQAP